MHGLRTEIDRQAAERQRLWDKLAADPKSPSRQHWAYRVRAITRYLNGHDQDCYREVFTVAPFHKPNEGLYANLRKSLLDG